MSAPSESKVKKENNTITQCHISPVLMHMKKLFLILPIAIIVTYGYFYLNLHFLKMYEILRSLIPVPEKPYCSMNLRMLYCFEALLLENLPSVGGNMVVSLENIYKSFGSAPILEDVGLLIEEGSRIGLIGVNGAGKTTLLRIILGELEPDSGTVSLAAGTRIGYLRQSSTHAHADTLYDELKSAFAPLLEMGEEIRALHTRLAQLPASGEEYAQAARRLSDLQSAFETGGGYEIDVKIDIVMAGMGFTGYDQSMAVDSLSGGERTRLALARLLLEEPDLLILDEPTNHLDFRTLQWLEEYLLKYKGAILVVTHDRYFLDNVTDKIAELEYGRLHTYKGGYSSYTIQKEQRLERARKEYETQQREIAKLRDFAARNIARASTSGMAKSRLAAIERMEILEAPKTRPKTARLHFAYDREPVKDVLLIEDLLLRAGGTGRELARCAQLHLRRGERVAVIGENGTGKSTFLKVVQGLLPAQYKRMQWGANVRASYYDQDNLQLHPEKTALSEVWDSFPNLREQDIRGLLATVLLVGDDVYKRIGELSGGERAKVALAKLSLARSNLLILDEPTNHLDLATKEIIDEALSGFTGTLLMVSHDRYLLTRVPTRIIEIAQNSMTSYEGGFAEYLKAKSLQEAAAAQAAPAPEQKSTPRQSYRSKKDRSAQVARRQHLSRVEEDIALCEADIGRIEQELTLPQVMEDYQRLTQLSQELEQRRHDLTALMDEWVEASAALSESGVEI